MFLAHATKQSVAVALLAWLLGSCAGVPKSGTSEMRSSVQEGEEGASSTRQTAPATSDAATELVQPVLQLGIDPIASCPYPLDAIRTEQRGTTVLYALIDVTGLPSGIRIESSSGSNALDDAGVECLMRARFLPGTRAGRPIPYPMRFHMHWEIPPPLRKSCGPRGIELPWTSRAIDSLSTVVCLCWDENGKPGEVVILQTSGSLENDNIAVETAEKDLHHPPGRAGCQNLRVKVQLR